MSSAGVFVVTRDGLPISGRVHTGELGAMGELIRAQPMSCDWAMRHEGYAVAELADAGATWSTDERLELARTARGLFRRHEHPDTFETADDERMCRENCGACALAGYGAHDDDGTAPLAPNYAGWARAYVQAGKRIPPEWVDGFRAELSSSNGRYADALATDVRTFGAAGIPGADLATVLR